MAQNPFDVLARAISRKSDLKLVKVEVTGASGALAQVDYRGQTVLVPVVGSVPSTGANMWMLVDKGVMLGLT